MWSNQDYQMMARAIELAKKGRYTTRPNPCVGCVITQHGQVVGEGFHIRAGGPHAEVHALAMAGERAQGGTAYVTLEPCSHYGRTPPCALALINAKVARVVVAVTDANPQVSGRGISMLKEAGIEVDVGLLADEAYQINLGFMKKMAQAMPLVTVKLACSIDGKTALSNGVSKWITGPQARKDVQRLRAQHCAVVTGSETVLADNPSMNVRYHELGYITEQLNETDIIQPLRVILDSRARLSHELAIFHIDSPLLLVSLVDYPESQQACWGSHVRHIKLPALDGRIDLVALFSYLADECNSVLIEAGATLAGAVIEAGLADRLVIYQAMKLLGSHGRNLVQFADYQTMEQLPQMQLVEQRMVGLDNRLTFSLGNK